MDTSGHIREVKNVEDIQDNEMPLTRQQARALSRQSFKKRKAWMRNKPCICGSGKKFKKCCWAKANLNHKEN